MELKSHQKELSNLAQAYHCDPKDPVFGILEKVLEIRDQIQHLPLASGSFEATTQKLSEQTEVLKQVLEKLHAENSRVEELTLKSAQNLLAAGQIHFREKFSAGFIGALGGLLIAAGILAYHRYSYWISLESKLSKAKIQFQLEEGVATQNLKKGTRLTLLGPPILGTGRTENKLVVEFDKEFNLLEKP